MHFEVSGSGPFPLVCIHGWACDGSQFRELSGRLEGAFRVFRPDLPGHGATPLGGFRPGFERYAEVIAEFVRDQQLDRPVLIGHSMGGVLCLIAAASGRVRPRAVVNLDGSLPITEGAVVGQRVLRGWLEEPDFRRRLAVWLRDTFFLPAERDARCDAIVRTMCNAPEAVLRFLPEQVDQLQPDRILPQIRVPVLFVGSASPRFDTSRARSLLPRLRLEQFPDVGHFLPVYAPDRVAALVRTFLASEVEGRSLPNG